MPPSQGPRHTLTPFQVQAFVTKYRPLAYLVTVAVGMGVQDRLVQRIREVNGEFADEKTEVFRHNILKDSGSSLTVKDLEDFLEWFTGPSTLAVGTRDKLSNKLRDLRRLRLARYQVMCPDGRVPEENRMLHVWRRNVANCFLPQAWKRMWRSWPAWCRSMIWP